MTGGPIYYLATPAQWADAQAVGALSPPSLVTEGFVHCSTADQLDATIARHFAGVEHLLLLRLDPDALADALRWEESHPREVFPHVYRAIDTAEVVEVTPWHRS